MQCHFHHPEDFDYKPSEGKALRKAAKGEAVESEDPSPSSMPPLAPASSATTPSAASTLQPPPASSNAASGKNQGGNANAAPAAIVQPAARGGATAPTPVPIPPQQPNVPAVGGAVSTSILLRAIDLVWPPSKQNDPKIWALSHTAKYLVLNSAAQVRNLNKKASGPAGAKYSNDDLKLTSAPKQNLKELMLEVEKAQDSNVLQLGLTSVVLGQAELGTHSLPLAKIGAELGLLWQKLGSGQGDRDR